MKSINKSDINNSRVFVLHEFFSCMPEDHLRGGNRQFCEITNINHIYFFDDDVETYCIG